MKFLTYLTEVYGVGSNLDTPFVITGTTKGEPFTAAIFFDSRDAAETFLKARGSGALLILRARPGDLTVHVERCRAAGCNAVLWRFASGEQLFLIEDLLRSFRSDVQSN